MSCMRWKHLNVRKRNDKMLKNDKGRWSRKSRWACGEKVTFALDLFPMYLAIFNTIKCPHIRVMIPFLRKVYHNLCFVRQKVFAIFALKEIAKSLKCLINGINTCVNQQIFSIQHLTIWEGRGRHWNSNILFIHNNTKGKTWFYKSWLDFDDSITTLSVIRSWKKVTKSKKPYKGGPVFAGFCRFAFTCGHFSLKKL